jgi:hypothetical protein
MLELTNARGFVVFAYVTVFKIEALARMSFILRDSQVSAFQLKGWFKSKTSIQEYRNEIQNSYTKLVHELYGACFQYNVKD